ncbi:MAG: NADH:ubiquinone oxidoreductase subunit NDUFA12 [Alphaproteobacteria bacterium]|nr:NADH:ubiquinone oxidoreductase subunit NDUFA12 [Alphaproteobacteria bacterium]HCQ71125.1 NADH:ubiquinone oxidoreductase subunit NDUFA12 [Rhodospirillaceae bacterium]|tara:strand:+ start:40217 stop:40630 length:414 start_codon:yes stop_codon:yes gene_type:complete
MSILDWIGVLSPAHIHCFNLFTAKELVGTDGYGNKYYRGKPRKGYYRERRWVMYKDSPEASLVPPEWHGWLHHQTDIIPAEDEEAYRREWQKPHTPNMTGTNQAYRPPGHILSGGQRDSATGDYEPWSPNTAINNTK